MTVRLDAAEKLVIRCTGLVRDGRLVDPAVAQPLAATYAPPRRRRVLDARTRCVGSRIQKKKQGKFP